MADDPVDDVVDGRGKRRGGGDGLGPAVIARGHLQDVDVLSAPGTDGEDLARAPTRALRVLAQDRYARFKPAGEGGMGIVYWAVDTDLNREVAFKLIRPQHEEGSPISTVGAPLGFSPPTRDAESSQAFDRLKTRFLQEAWLTGGLSHPGIVPVYELGQTSEGVPYYTMRFVRGERTLKDAIAEAKDGGIEGRLALLEPFLRVCDTVAYAHARGVIHRDLKPENVALGEFGEVVVLDWGLATLKDRPDSAPELWQGHVKAFREAAALQTIGSATGTPGFMSPEAARGDVGSTDERSDVYSLGAILFQILTGRLPHPLADLGEHLCRLLTEDAPTAVGLDPAVPRALSDLCARALARERPARPAGAAELAASVRLWQAQSAADREIDGWLHEIEGVLETAEGLSGDARLRALDRASAACTRILEERPHHAAALGHRLAIEGLRERGVQERVRATRRRTLARGTAVVLVLATVSAILVTGLVDRKRQEAVRAQEREAVEHARAVAALGRARVLGLVSASAEASRAQPMLALLLATEAVRAAPSSPAALSRLQEAVATSRERLALSAHADVVTGAARVPGTDSIVTGSRDGTARVWDAKGRTTAVLVGHEGPIVSVDVSPDGERIVTASEDKTARLWTLEGQPLSLLRGHEKEVTAARFSPRGDRILTASLDATARLWDLDGVEKARFSDHRGGVLSAEFSPSGNAVVTTSEDAVARRWDVEGRATAVLRGSPEAGGARGFTGARFSPTGDLVATFGREPLVRLWDGTGTVVATLGGERGLARMVAFSPAGDRVLVAWSDRRASAYDLEGRERAVLEGHAGVVGAVAFSPRGDRMATGSTDGTAAVWDLEGRRLADLRGHEGPVVHVAFSPTGEDLVTLSHQGRAARVWDVGSRQPGVLRGHADAVVSVVCSASGDRILTASHDRTARLWDRHGTEIAVMRGHGDGLRGAVFSPDERTVLTASSDGTARLWDLEGRALAVLGGHGNFVFRALFTPRGDRILTSGADGTARIWDLGGAPTATFRSPAGETVLSVSPKGDRVATASLDQTVRLWDLEGRELAAMRGHGQTVMRVLFSPRGDFLASTGADGTVRLWDVDGGARAVSRGDRLDGRALDVSPDGSRILTAARDGTGQLWDVEGGLVATMQGHTQAVPSALFSPTGDRVLTGSQDTTARLWDLEGNELMVLRGHEDWVRSVTFTSDGRFALTAAADGTARMWPLHVGDLLEAAARRTTRPLTAEERRRYGDLLGEPESAEDRANPYGTEMRASPAR